MINLKTGVHVLANVTFVSSRSELVLFCSTKYYVICWKQVKKRDKMNEELLTDILKL